jgi:hypothetical protein
MRSDASLRRTPIEGAHADQWLAIVVIDDAGEYLLCGKKGRARAGPALNARTAAFIVPPICSSFASRSPVTSTAASACC